MTEALAVIASLSYNASRNSLNDSTTSLAAGSDIIPLKLALFNLSKFIKEQDFAVELMDRGGDGLLIDLIERPDGGLTGNSLAVRDLLHRPNPDSSS